MASTIDGLNTEAQYARPTLTKVEVPVSLAEQSSQSLVAFIEQELIEYHGIKNLVRLMPLFVEYSLKNTPSNIDECQIVNAKNVMINMGPGMLRDTKALADRKFGGNMARTIGVLARIGHDRYAAAASEAVAKMQLESKAVSVGSTPPKEEPVISYTKDEEPSPEKKLMATGRILAFTKEYDDYYTMERLHQIRIMLGLQMKEVSLAIGRSGDFVRRAENNRPVSQQARIDLLAYYAHQSQIRDVKINWYKNNPPFFGKPNGN